jgi:hypothetical protein
MKLPKLNLNPKTLTKEIKLIPIIDNSGDIQRVELQNKEEKSKTL